MNLLNVFFVACLLIISNGLANDIVVKPISAKASSIYPADGANYYPTNAMDDNHNTAWSSDRTEKANIGEWLEFDFGKNVTLSKLKIYNGWIKSDSVWKLNSRVKRATLTFSDNSKQSIILEDTKSEIFIDIGLKETNSVRLTIDEIYTGNKWNQEACITDVYFYLDEKMSENYKYYEALLQPYKEKDTLSGYHEFLEKYPESPQTKDIENIIEKKYYEEAKKVANIQAYEDFISLYPNSTYVNEVKELIYETAYNKAEKDNTLESYINFKKKYSQAKQVSKIDNKLFELAKFSLRQTYKEGAIGERYVPTSTYTSSTPNSTTTYINGKAYTSTMYDTNTSYSGGSNEKVYGYKLIYDITNQSKNYYIVSLEAKWDGYYSHYQTYNTGAWGDGDTRTKLVEETQSSKYLETFLLGPDEIYKDQFEVGEKKPENLNIVISQLEKVDKSYYEGLVKALSYSQKKEIKNED
ncbi:MAG: hypothetical protein RBR07_07805 [Arcobacteraceae bacterium]|nr:hypothetical protein [Arcobacteraceae bacterium]